MWFLNVCNMKGSAQSFTVTEFCSEILDKLVHNLHHAVPVFLLNVSQVGSWHLPVGRVLLYASREVHSEDKCSAETQANYALVLLKDASSTPPP